MNKRKILTLALSLCMVAILAIGGTLAYFTDTEQAINTMVVGNVEIDIDEWTLTNGEWAPFEDDTFVLYPIDNAQGTQLYNKMVYTANTSSSEDDAYIRNIVLIEANDEITDDNETGCCLPGIHYGFATNDKSVSATDGKTYVGSRDTGLDSNVTAESVTINGEKYWVVVFEEKDGQALSYDEALISLNSVWMDENVTSEQIDGWGADNKVDIIVFSQGIQATGLTHAQAMAELGEVSEANLQSWIGGESADFDADDWTDK